MRFHRRGIYAHAAPHPLGSISRARTPLRALSSRKAAEPREVDIKNESGACELPEDYFDPGSTTSPFFIRQKRVELTTRKGKP